MENIKVRKKIYRAVSFISFVMLMVTMGGLEFETISFAQGIVQGIVFLVTFGIFTKLAGGFEPCEETAEDLGIEPPNEDEHRKAV